MSTFEAHPWAVTLAVGLPLAVAFAVWQWRAASRSLWRRWLVSFILVFPITPFAIVWTNGHSDGGSRGCPRGRGSFLLHIPRLAVYCARVAAGTWALVCYVVLTQVHSIEA